MFGVSMLFSLFRRILCKFTKQWNLNGISGEIYSDYWYKLDHSLPWRLLNCFGDHQTGNISRVAYSSLFSNWFGVMCKNISFHCSVNLSACSYRWRNVGDVINQENFVEKSLTNGYLFSSWIILLVQMAGKITFDRDIVTIKWTELMDIKRELEIFLLP